MQTVSAQRPRIPVSGFGIYGSTTFGSLGGAPLLCGYTFRKSISHLPAGPGGDAAG
jgi:hypothetical protein